MLDRSLHLPLCWSSDLPIASPAASRSGAISVSFPVKTPAPIVSDWGISASKATSLLRFLLVEAAQAAVRWDTDWRRRFVHLAMRRDPRIAKVAMARKLAVSLYWMWRKDMTINRFEVRFARGRAWLRPWCEVNHRPLDWASRSLSREFEVVIMVERAIGEMVGSDRVPPERLHASLRHR